MVKRFKFDEHYYDRYYRNARTQVVSRSEQARAGRFLASYLKHLDQPVKTVLDLGCGLGAWQDICRRCFPKAIYTGVEISPYLCRKYGWERGSVVDYQSEEPQDLIICQGVLQYLDARDARRAIANLAKLAQGAVFLEVLTAEDWERNCDRGNTDGDVYLRKAAWYRHELGKQFANCGGGV